MEFIRGTEISCISQCRSENENMNQNVEDRWEFSQNNTHVSRFYSNNNINDE